MDSFQHSFVKIIISKGLNEHLEYFQQTRLGQRRYETSFLFNEFMNYIDLSASRVEFIKISVLNRLFILNISIFRLGRGESSELFLMFDL